LLFCGLEAALLSHLKGPGVRLARDFVRQGSEGVRKERPLAGLRMSNVGDGQQKRELVLRLDLPCAMLRPIGDSERGNNAAGRDGSRRDIWRLSPEPLLVVAIGGRGRRRTAGAMVRASG